MKRFDEAEVMAAWEAKNRNAKCPICGNGAWELQDYWTALPTSDLLGGPEGPGYLPVLAGICQSCGNVNFWSVTALGLA